LESKTGEILKTKIYDKGDHFTLPIVNFPFINANIPAITAYFIHFTTHMSGYKTQNEDKLSTAQQG
jgi:hypothetical protein